MTGIQHPSRSATRRTLERAALAGVLGIWPGAAHAAAGPAAGLLVTGQSNAELFIADGGVRILNQGLAALLSLRPASYDPHLPGLTRLDGYGLSSGLKRDPATYSTMGGVPLWHPGHTGAFLLHRQDQDPAQWPRGRAGGALRRFVRRVLTPQDRAACLGILWLHTEDDSRARRLPEAATHAAAIRRHLALIREDFGRPARGPGALPAFAWLPVPFGSNAEGHRAVRAAFAELIADEEVNFHLALPQTADSDQRSGSDVWHVGTPDFMIFARRAAYAIAHALRPADTDVAAQLPGPGPRILRAIAEGPTRTRIIILHDRGRRLLAPGAAGDGRGWSVAEAGIERQVTAMQILGPAELWLEHAACTASATARLIGYCLNGERLGRGNAITDDWSQHGEPPTGLGPDWRLDMPLQGSLLPVRAIGAA